ncbi:4-carboxy-2-hydroxymuconate-6-semialdehyde dehydrogenase [Roseivivax jejudonensis]|uniref:4-carboxy-2-hydroxymuconate-6-semialdehyde dehydrogenase n=1 Tax=Roseivivax jejudonensis TaxID=1529041 RepID=A0A1X7A5S9_9RHOB|nr:Gfo/Idh/MocA family oxidoreductase [Roseivivax jejudonensis]SLN71049.1 4-carboxy-2-hydroxymuconate-6-semialdehyde dehydrogenase [Roseivivax jejudonensis]
MGEGAIAEIHMEALASTCAQVTHLVPGETETGARFASKHQISSICNLDELLASDVDGVIVATPSDLHATHAQALANRGIPSLVEIPMATRLEDAEALAILHAPLMIAHTRRFSPAHRAMKARIESGETLQHLVAQTYFMRRENRNMMGKPRTWVDSLIWHHAVHSVDLFLWLTGDTTPDIAALAGPPHPEMGCVMDLAVVLRSRAGTLMTLACSFNNDGPFGGFYRYVCEGGTWHVFRDELTDAGGASVATEGAGGFVSQDQTFLDGIAGHSEFEPTPTTALPAMQIVEKIARITDALF